MQPKHVAKRCNSLPLQHCLLMHTATCTAQSRSVIQEFQNHAQPHSSCQGDSEGSPAMPLASATAPKLTTITTAHKYTQHMLYVPRRPAEADAKWASPAGSCLLNKYGQLHTTSQSQADTITIHLSEGPAGSHACGTCQHPAPNHHTEDNHNVHSNTLQACARPIQLAGRVLPIR